MTVWIQNPFDNLPCEGYRKQRFYLMAEAFAAAGHRVVLWTSDFSHANKAKRVLSSLPTAFGLRLVPTPPYNRNVSLARVRSHRAFARAWKRLAREETEKPALIVASMPTLSGAAAALDLGREFGARVVVDVMDAWPETFARLFPKALSPLASLVFAPLARQARRIYREADLVTGVCARYRELSGRGDYHLAYHGIELEGPAPLCEDRPDGSPIRLVYAGNVGRTYDIETILRAVEENPDFSLVIAGRWTKPVPKRVAVKGYLNAAALERLLAACDVGIVPMRPNSWVGVPYKLCDYAKAGLRVVSSLGGESLDLLERHGCGYAYEPGDARSLAAAIRAAFALPRENARRLCAAEFDARAIYADYVRFCLGGC